MKPQKTRASFISWDVAFYGLAAVAAFGILLLHAGKKSLTTDELYRLGFYMDKASLSGILSGCWEVRGANPPLFNLLAWAWFRLVPYGQRYLQLLPALCASLGVFFTGLAGRAYRGRLTGALSAVCAMASPGLLITGGLQFAQYGVLLLFSGLTAYGYFHRTCGQCGWGSIVLYGVSMAFLPYSHYVAVLIPMTLFLGDVVLYCKKELPLRAFASYLIGGGLFFPWGLAILKTTGQRTEFWIGKPRLMDIPDTFRFLTDDNGVLLILFVLGLCAAAVSFAYALLEKRLSKGTLLPLLVAVVPLLSVGALFFYSTCIRPDVPLYLSRYFLGCIPFLALTEAYAAERALRYTVGQSPAPLIAVCMSLFLLLFFRSDALVREDVSTPNELYREAADCLCEQADIYAADTAVVTSNLSAYVTRGWTEYYVARQGQREAFAAYDYDTPFTEDAAARYAVVYAFTEHAGLPEETVRILVEQYRPDAGFTEGEGCGVVRYVRAGE